MSSSLIILIGFIISATLMTIIWLGLKYNQKKRRAQAEIEKQKVDILSRIEEAVSNVSTANEPDRRRLPSDQQYGLPTWGKYLLVLTWLPFIASLVFAGVHSQNKNLKPSTTSNITTIISSSTTQPKATVSTTASATTGNVTVYSTTPSKPNTTPISTTSVPAATLIQYGQTVTGQIAFSNDYQNWQFTGQAGDVITIQMVQDGGASLKPEVELFDPSGARVSYNWGGNGYTEADITNYKLADSGSYIIRAETTEGYPATIGGYKISLLVILPNAVIAYGQKVTGNISYAGDYQDWKFTGQAGDVITIQMVQDGGASLKPELVLFDPSGARVSYNWGGNGYTEADITNYKLAYSGSYIIRAETTEGYPATIGGYKISLLVILPTAIIAYGQEVTGNISYAGDYQDWKFTGQAGDIITIQMVQDGGASLKPEVELFDPSGARVSYNWGGNGYTEAGITNYTLRFSGSYIIRAETTEGYPATIGGYKVSLNKK